MRRIRIAGLCLVAVCAMSIIASSTASAAAPEFGRCIKKAVKSLPGYTRLEMHRGSRPKKKKASYEWLPGSGAENRIHDHRRRVDSGHQRRQDGDVHL